MKSMHRQRGMTPIGWILVLLLIAFFALIALKLIPVYLESFSVATVISDLKDEPGIGSKNASEIINIVKKRLTINNVYGVTADDIFVEKIGGTMTISAEYEVRKTLLGNVDLCISFNKAVEVDAR